MSDAPRLLFCVFDVVPSPTSVSRRLLEYLRGLTSSFRVSVLSLKSAEHRHIETAQGAQFLRVPVGSGDLSQQVNAFERAVRRQLESDDYLLVHFFDPFSGYSACERRAERSAKLVYDACGFVSYDAPPHLGQQAVPPRFRAKARRQELFCLLNADAVVTASQLASRHLASIGVPPSRVHVLHHPVDLAAWAKAPPGPPDRVPMRLIHLGRVDKPQAIGDLLRALQHSRRAAETRLALVGPRSSSETAALRDEIARLGLEDVVALYEPVSHEGIRNVLGQADVGVAPVEDSERNRVVGSPRSKVAEYLAAGRPVLLPDLPLSRELAPSGAAVFYQPDRVESLSRAIVELATNPARRVLMGEQARRAAPAHDAQAVRAQLLALYGALCDTTFEPCMEEIDTEETANQTVLSETPSAAAAEVPSDASRTTLPRPESVADGAPARRPRPPAPPPRPPEAPSRVELPAGTLGEPPLAPPEDAGAPPDSGRRTTLPMWPPDLVPAPEPSAAPRSPQSPPAPSALETPPSFPAPRAPIAEGARFEAAASAQAKARASSTLDEADELSADDVQPVDAPPEQPSPSPEQPSNDAEPPLLDADELQAQTIETRAFPAKSLIDPWFAQAVHGYCPPEAGFFERHTPPTTTPGRDT